MDNDRNSSLYITRGHLNGFSLAGVTCGPALYCYRICVMHVLVTISLTDLSNTCISSYYPISHQNDLTRVQISNKRNEWSILFTSSELVASSCKSRGICFFLPWPSPKSYYTFTFTLSCFVVNNAETPSGNLIVQSMFTTLPHNNLVMRTKQDIIRRFG